MTRTCPPESALVDLLADRLAPDVEAAIEEHLSACQRCCDRLDELTGWDEQDDLSPPPPAQDTGLPYHMAATVAARLAGVLPPAGVGRKRPPASPMPVVPGYELLAEVGRGGCGVVYRAVDRALARTVALKLLHDRAGPTARERFRREAEALARLRHPNVVQIYGVGTDAAQPFLALEYVAGDNLGRFTAGQPQDPVAAAVVVEAVARGVGTAHTAGLVHRDLKPANILLERRPAAAGAPALADFVPKVTDFGTVKGLVTDSWLTDTHDFLGTPSYMAPEQAGAGKLVDHRADVYALGAILYELLTGRPPFRAATPIDTLVQVAFDEPVPPSRLQPRLPRDVETVCLKCLEKDPARRYATAEALADDLARFAAGRPVHARPVRWPARAWRWCRRNPARAVAAALAASVVLGLAAGGPLVARRERQLRHEADANRSLAVSEREHARQNLDLASRALDETLGGLVVNARLRAYGMDDVRADLLRGAVPYLEEFASRVDESPDIRARQGRAAIQLANVDVRDGRQASAREGFERGVDLFAALAAGPGGERFAAELSMAHAEYGRFLLTVAAEPAAADRHLREALRLADGVAADDHGTAAQRDNKAIILSLLASVPGTSAAERAARVDLLSRALHIRERLVSENPARPDLRHYAAATAFNLGLMLTQLGRQQEAAEILDRGLAVGRRPTGPASTSMYGPRLRIDLEGLLGEALIALGRHGDGLDHLRAAVRTACSAAELFPVEVEYTAKALLWHDTLANALERRREVDAATDVRRAAVAFAAGVVDAAPDVEANRDGLLAARVTLAEQLNRRGLAEAVAEFAAAAAVGRQLTGLPDDRERAANRAELFRRIGGFDLDNGRYAVALAWFDRSVVLIERDPTWTDGPFRRAVETSRAAALDRLGRPADAAAARAKAAACRRPEPPHCPARPVAPTAS